MKITIECENDLEREGMRRGGMEETQEWTGVRSVVLAIRQITEQDLQHIVRQLSINSMQQAVVVQSQEQQRIICVAPLNGAQVLRRP